MSCIIEGIAAAMCELQERRKANKWIKCSEQLPENDTLCLGVDELGVIWTLHFEDGFFRPDTGDNPGSTFIRWMLLPEVSNGGEGVET